MNNKKAHYNITPLFFCRSCVEVPISVTARIEGDIFGNWKTETTFKQNSSAFMLDMSGTSINSEEYTSIMLSFRDQLKALSAKSALRDAAWNAVAWATYVFQDDNSGMQLYSSADSKYFFEDNDFGMGVITTAKGGLCPWVYQWASYDPADHTLVYNIRQRSYSEDIMQNYLAGYNGTTFYFLDACPDQYPLHQFAPFKTYTTVDTTGLLQLKFDVHSLMIATSLNWNLTTYSAYTQVKSSYGSSGVYGIPGTFWIDPSLDDYMEPVFCLDLKAVNAKYNLNLESVYLNGNPVCFLVKGSMDYPILYYPVALSAYGDDLTGEYLHCKCPESRSVLTCNQRDYVFSLFYSFPGQDPNTGIANPVSALALALQLQRMLVDDPISGDVKVQEFVSPLISSAWQIAPEWGPAAVDSTQDSYTDANGVYHDYSFMHGTFGNTHLIEWKKVCPNGNCGAVLFETYKGTGNNEFLPLNKYEYQVTQNPAISDTYLFSNKSGKHVYLKRMMCENALYIPGAIEKLSERPPVSIIQPFFQCHDTVLAGLTTAAGK
jgi:hypothetical protein